MTPSADQVAAFSRPTAALRLRPVPAVVLGFVFRRVAAVGRVGHAHACRLG